MKKLILATGICILLICSSLTITVAAEPIIRLPTQTVKMKAVYTANSWFAMTLTNVPAGFDVTNSPPTYPGWCVQVLVNMTLNVNHSVQLISSYDTQAVPSSTNWDKVNYIINNYEGYDRQTIQEVIWYFINNDALPANNTDAQTLAADANASGDGFIPTYGQKIAIVANVKDGEYQIQHTFFEVTLRDAVSLGDFVWNDQKNKNGIQDDDEPGMQGITVRLQNETNATIQTTTTDSYGYYSFSGYPEGNYSLKFEIPPNYRFSPANQGSDDSIDSDVDQSTGKTPLITAFTATNDMSWDAGIYQVEEPGTPGTPGTPTPPPQTPNIPPTADGNAKGVPYVALLGDPIFFNGSRSTDSDGTIVTWLWTFGDGTTGNNATLLHNYTNPGKYIVTLTVTDNDGATDTYTTNATVRLPNQPPLPPTLTGSKTGSTDESYVLRFVTTDPNDDLVRYLISWGDGTQNHTIFLPSAQNSQMVHHWNTWGFFTIQVYAKESYENLSSDISSLVVAVDVFYIGSLGYLIDTDSNGLYDAFYSNATGLQTAVQRQQTGVYLIDTSGDGNFDYQYDPTTGSSREYPEALSPSYTMLLVGVGVVILVLLIIGFLMKRRWKKPKQ